MDREEYEAKLQRRKAKVSTTQTAGQGGDSFAWHFLPGLVLGIGLGWALSLWTKSSQSGASEEKSAQASSPARAKVPAGEPMKMVFLVNDELKMTKGKIAAQCGHAVYGLTKKLQQSSPATLAQWESCGQAKIALRADGGVPQMRELARNAAQLNIPSHAVFDAGRTQIAAGSQTVVALGPAGKSLLDSVTGHLKLL